MQTNSEIPSKNLCFGIELEVFITMPDTFKPKPGKISEWYQAGRYILGKHKKWINEKYNDNRPAPWSPWKSDEWFVDPPPGLGNSPHRESVDKMYWPIRPGKTDFQTGKDWPAWKELVDSDASVPESDANKDAVLINSDERNEWDDPQQKDGMDFLAWTLVSERLGTLDKSHTYGFELVAPVLRYGLVDPVLLRYGEIKPRLEDLSIRADYGLEAISQLYQFFKEAGFKISVNEKCSSHVHVSPELVLVKKNDKFTVESAWTLQRLKNMSSAAFYFEVPMRSLMEETRRGNGYAQEFHTDAWLVKKHYDAYFKNPRQTDLDVVKELQSISSVDALKDRMNPDLNRNWTWNYRNLSDRPQAPKQSLEFRWPAGSPDHFKAWEAVDLAVAFTLAGCENGTYEKLEKCAQDIDGLLKFLEPFVREGSIFKKGNKAYEDIRKKSLVPFEAPTVEPNVPDSIGSESLMAQKLSSSNPITDVDAGGISK